MKAPREENHGRRRQNGAERQIQDTTPAAATSEGTKAHRPGPLAQRRDGEKEEKRQEALASLPGPPLQLPAQAQLLATLLLHHLQASSGDGTTQP